MSHLDKCTEGEWRFINNGWCGFYIVKDTDFAPRPIGKAHDINDAKLMAASKEMYSALEAIVNACRRLKVNVHDEDGDNLIRTADWVLAKARGEK